MVGWETKKNLYARTPGFYRRKTCQLSWSKRSLKPTCLKKTIPYNRSMEHFHRYLNI